MEFDEIVEAQGKKKQMSIAKYHCEIKSKKSGTVKELNNKLISGVSFIVGCPNDKSAGAYIHKRVGDKVKKGELLMDLYSNSEQKLKYAKAFVEEEHPYIIK